MIIDILFIILIIYAIFQGMRKGFILGIISFVAFFIGLAAALKLSAIVAVYLRTQTSSTSWWLPFLSFLLVFILFIILVSFIGRLIKKAVQLAMLGWLDSLLGIVVYVAIYSIIFSILLFYLTRSGLISPQTVSASRFYSYISTWGPSLIERMGSIIPLFKNMFTELEEFFKGMGKNA